MSAGLFLRVVRLAAREGVRDEVEAGGLQRRQDDRHRHRAV